ncbi:DUF2171 domain-containing protein [Sphingomonas jatrophae]|uniref:Outer membrane protein OmpA n=1 Tax=Sphingomonas jatrophae TaxID=1166337 RepID=A0A1I6LIM0_9SPHN|nr:DUF2171 domain-containing protein [Sphingomonas jatrophae]SFS03279.1 Outer membrane protein OmpA [Sphingomonas jatrophae]
MVKASDIRAHMAVVDSVGVHVGTVDHAGDDGIKLARKDAGDGKHHHLPLSAVARVDEKVHLNNTAALLDMPVAAVGAAAGAAGASHDGLLPPVKNRAVDDAKPRGNFYLPWIVGIVGVILLLLLLRSCLDRDEPAPVADPAATATASGATAALPVEAVALPNGTSVNVEPNSLNYSLQRYLASNEAAPRTFQFDKLNFDTSSAVIRPEDQANVDALAQILAAYPAARGRITGYTDARGSGAANATLGAERAQAVVAALTAKGIDASRLEAVSGGEANPTDSNATSEGQFENRRTELTVTAK